MEVTGITEDLGVEQVIHGMPGIAGTRGVVFGECRDGLVGESNEPDNSEGIEQAIHGMPGIAVTQEVVFGDG